MNEIDLLEISKTDLLAAKELHHKKIYAHSLVFFYQSVEKATKYSALAIGGISELDLEKKIKHDSIKLFQELLRYFNANTSIPIAIDPHIFTNLRNMILNISDQERVNIIWKLIDDILNTPLAINDTSKPLQAMIDYSKKMGLCDPVLQKPMKGTEYEWCETLMKESLINQIVLINWGEKIFQLLFAYSLFTNCYKIDELRYPNKTIGNPMDYFNEENSYVKEIQLFIKMFERILDTLGRIVWK